MRRVRYALAACLGASLLVLAFACHPLCAVYGDDPWHPLYWFYSCNDCPPPSPIGG